jgi:hypothetical protein
LKNLKGKKYGDAKGVLMYIKKYGFFSVIKSNDILYVCRSYDVADALHEIMENDYGNKNIQGETKFCGEQGDSSNIRRC